MLEKGPSEALSRPLRPTEGLRKYLFSEGLSRPQRPTVALRKYNFLTLYKTIARARRARAPEISRNQNSTLQDVTILWSITLIKILAFAAGPEPIPEILIESTSM